MKKYPIYSDTHVNFTFPWTQYDFVETIREQNPAGLILTGDIACGLTIERFLTFIAKKLEVPIYFVIGNHDYYSRSIADINAGLKKLTAANKNLIWVSEIDSVAIKDDVGIIGEDGWYDGKLGNPAFLAYNFDWIMISEFRALKSFEEKIAYGRKLSDLSTERLKVKLLTALEKYKTIYILTHMPPWQEAARHYNTDTAEFWLPYNVNSGMGDMIESVMKDYPDQNVIVCAGHVHLPSMLHVAHNIDCHVLEGKYLGSPREQNLLYI